MVNEELSLSRGYESGARVDLAEIPLALGQRLLERHDFVVLAALKATQGQIVSPSLTDATSGR